MADEATNAEAQIVPPLPPGMRAVLIYTTAERFTPEIERLLVESGYIPIQCERLDQVRILPLTVTHTVAPAQLDAITQAALQAIDHWEGTTITVPGAFGTALAKLLLNPGK